MAEDSGFGDFKSANVVYFPLLSLSHSDSTQECWIENMPTLGHKPKHRGANRIHFMFRAAVVPGVVGGTCVDGTHPGSLCF